MASIIFILSVYCTLTHLAGATIFCNGSLEGTLHDNVLVNGESCTISAHSTIDGNINVVKKGALLIEAGVTINGNITLRSSASLLSNGKYFLVRINGAIRDYNGTGSFLLCGTYLSSKLVILRRNGDINLGFGSCSGNTMKRPIRVVGGSGTFSFDGNQNSNFTIEGKLPNLSITDRKGDTNIWYTEGKANVQVVASDNVYFQSVALQGETRLVRNGFVHLSNMTQNGVLIVDRTEGIVVGSDIRSRGTARLSNNGRCTISGQFDKAICYGNGFPFFLQKSSVKVGRGQCKQFEK